MQADRPKSLCVVDTPSPTRAASAASRETALPCPAFASLADHIVFHQDVARPLRRLSNVILRSGSTRRRNAALNRFLILRGPPGVGKTTTARLFCESCAQSLLTRSARRSVLFELHASAMFSDLLGRTPQALAAFFEEVRHSARHKDSFVIIDEIESLAYARGRIGAADPTDVLRTTNQLLHELDAFVGDPNVLIIATTNLATRLDEALLDRADLVLRFPAPDVPMAEAILRRSAEDARRLGIEVTPGAARETAEALCGLPPRERPSCRTLSKLVLRAHLHGETGIVGTRDLVAAAQRMSATEDATECPNTA